MTRQEYYFSYPIPPVREMNKLVGMNLKPSLQLLELIPEIYSHPKMPVRKLYVELDRDRDICVSILKVKEYYLRNPTYYPLGLSSMCGFMLRRGTSTIASLYKANKLAVSKYYHTPIKLIDAYNTRLLDAILATPYDNQLTKTSKYNDILITEDLIKEIESIDYC